MSENNETMTANEDAEAPEVESPTGETTEQVVPRVPPEPETEAEKAEPDTFPREYVEQLRKEAADNRVKAKRADDLAHRLHGALVAATGRLADPDDLPYIDGHLDDPDALEEAITGLLERKPHLASRRPVGNVGQGATATDSPVDLAGLLRARA